MRHVREPSQAEWEELERMTQQEVGRVALRAQMVLLSAQGLTVPEIADLQQISDVAVYGWLDRFDEEGPEGLYDRPRSGRPRKVTEEVEEEIEDSLSEPPTEQGYNFTVWTIPLLKSHLEKERETSLARETIRRALHYLGFRWRRPRWTVTQEDPEAKAIMHRICQRVLEADDETLILIEDETIFKRLPPLRQMWMRQGEQVKVPTPKQNGSQYLYGVLELNTGDTFHAFEPKGNTACTIDYLEQLLAHYPDSSILLIWDQASYHDSQAVHNWLADHPRITMLLLPKYAAELNPVESIWRQLKKQVAANLNRSFSAIKEAVDRFFAEHTPMDLLRMAGLLPSS